MPLIGRATFAMRRTIIPLLVLLAAGGASAQEAAPGGGLSEQVMKIAGIGAEVVLISLAVVAAALLAWLGYAYYARHRSFAPSPLLREEKEIEVSRFEQVLAELQGIRLGFESGNDTAGNFEKFARLVRIFASRAGIPAAREMPLAKLRDALTAAHFSAKHVQMLVTILERCDKAMHVRRGTLDFDPKELVKDFKYVIDQIEGRVPTTD